MVHYEIKFENGGSEIHFGGVSQQDVALCLHDLSGDSLYGRGYSEAKITSKKVNCKDCIRIVECVKKINKNEYVPGN